MNKTGVEIRFSELQLAKRRGVCGGGGGGEAKGGWGGGATVRDSAKWSRGCFEKKQNPKF